MASLKAARAQQGMFLDAVNSLPREPETLMDFHAGRRRQYNRDGRDVSSRSQSVEPSARGHLKARVANSLAGVFPLPPGGMGPPSYQTMDKGRLAQEALDAWAESYASEVPLALALSAGSLLGVETNPRFPGGWDFFAPSLERPREAYEELFLRTYESTQRYLADRGVKELHLFRGMGWDNRDQAPAELALWLADEDAAPIMASFRLRPLSSFSADPRIAFEFAWLATSGKGFAALAAATVPAARVFSLPMTGPGCLVEAEAVVLGGACDVTLFRVDPYEGMPEDALGGHWPGREPAGFSWTEADVGQE